MALRAEIAAGKPKVNVPAAMKKFIEIAEINGKKEVLFRYEAWQQEADRKGFYAIASSDELSAAEIHSLYGLCDASEKQFSMLKSRLARYPCTKSPEHRKQARRGFHCEHHPH